MDKYPSCGVSVCAWEGFEHIALQPRSGLSLLCFGLRICDMTSSFEMSRTQNPKIKWTPHKPDGISFSPATNKANTSSQNRKSMSSFVPHPSNAAQLLPSSQAAQAHSESLRPYQRDQSKCGLQTLNVRCKNSPVASVLGSRAGMVWR